MIFLHHSSLLKKHKAGFFASLQTLQRDQQKQRVCSSERPNEFFLPNYYFHQHLLYSIKNPLMKCKTDHSSLLLLPAVNQQTLLPKLQFLTEIMFLFSFQNTFQNTIVDQNSENLLILKMKIKDSVHHISMSNLAVGQLFQIFQNAIGPAKFFWVKSADPHVKIWVKRQVHTNFERPSSISYHVTRAPKLAILA